MGRYLERTDLLPLWNKIKEMMAEQPSGGGESGGGVNLLTVYPVGSIYLSTVATSPATLFGGTWERIQDTFLLAAGSTYAAGATGGEATHKLTTAEMPQHTHSTSTTYGSSGNLPVGNSGNTTVVRSTTTSNTSTGSAGSNAAHNNMPPYLAVYVWKRTA